MNEFAPKDLKEKLENHQSVFVKLWKPGCGACKLSESATRRLEESEKSRLEFAKIDVAEYPEMLDISDSEVLPAFFVFVEGKLKQKVIGFKGIKKLQDAIDQSFGG